MGSGFAFVEWQKHFEVGDSKEMERLFISDMLCISVEFSIPNIQA
jgi:hypothetical protein